MTHPAGRLREALPCRHSTGGIQCGPGAKKRSQSKTIDTFTFLREIKMPAIHVRLAVFSAALVILAASYAQADEKKYDTGATDTEIKIGNIMPYSGPASAYGVIGKTEQA